MSDKLFKSYSPELVKLVLDLHDVGVVKFGNFKLKSGIDSPIYFDLRVVISFPDLLEDVSNFMWDAISNKRWDTICGVPYTGIYMASVIAYKQRLSLINRRKEVKSHGTKGLIDGVYKEGQTCLLVEDLIVSGSSIYETVEVLQNEKLVVTDAIVLLDRMQGGVENLKRKGLNVSSVIDVENLLQILHDHQKIDNIQLEECKTFFALNSSVRIPTIEKSIGTKKLSFLEKSSKATHPIVRKICDLVLKKKTNLCIAVDVLTTSELLLLADMVGPHICLLKTHIDILKDFSKETATKLKELALKHDFLLFEDRKFGDIGYTVKNQFCGGLHNISNWADIVTVHGLPGPGIIKGLSSAVTNNNIGFIIVGEMSSEGNLCNSKYLKGCVKIAEENPDHVIGFVAQSCLSSNANHLIFTPGINLQSSGDCFGQKYIPVLEAILEKGTDIIIVGRGITSSDDPKVTARIYQERGFNALMKLVNEK